MSVSSSSVERNSRAKEPHAHHGVEKMRATCSVIIEHLNAGKVPKLSEISAETGVPERTIRYWFGTKPSWSVESLTLHRERLQPSKSPTVDPLMVEVSQQRNEFPGFGLPCLQW